MSLVVLMSGGMDSTLVAAMAHEEGIEVRPIFVDYGQRAVKREWAACQNVAEALGLESPARADLAGYGALVPSGLTRNDLDLNEDAFLPGRNLLFLLVAAAYAKSIHASGVAIGLLDEQLRLFPDQSKAFLESAQATISAALGEAVSVTAPLITWPKAAVIAALAARGIVGTYSCHSGQASPCGECIACLEIDSAAEG